MAKVLIVDAEQDIVDALKIYLSSQEYELYEAHTGKEALEMMEKEEIDLVLMDIMMPVMDGISAVAKIRQISNVPIILLTAKSEDSDKVLGLDIGADDYITKPFSPAEVIARVKSQLRRYTRLGSHVQQTGEIVIGGIVLNDNEKKVTVDGTEVSLTPVEYGILKLLMSRPGQVYSSAQIYRLVWHDVPMGAEGTVAVHIRHLREKIEINPSEPRYIKVVWGQGYKMEAYHG
ncbi:MAG: response regulator transcription factor [Solobacterium sp.]|nr:response regulator transcription factor [Solobacterium sp.]